MPDVGWKPVKKLAIHGEQGLGDEILFLTCLAQLKDRAEEIEIEVAPRLVKLIQHSFPGSRFTGSTRIASFEPMRTSRWAAFRSCAGRSSPMHT
jgi:hypothetical protein